MRFYLENKTILEGAEKFLGTGPFNRISGTGREMWEWAQGDRESGRGKDAIKRKQNERHISRTVRRYTVFQAVRDRAGRHEDC